jgi:A/G-specific adenine glycosylase
VAVALHERVIKWYDEHARDLPWRRPGTTPWGVVVSEFMLQQTQVARVMPEYVAWLERWPAPLDLATDPPSEAVRQWGRLGYPRRALRLHAAAVAMVERHGGAVPSSYDDLRELPGVGDYTAAAIAAFAFGRANPVLDTNVRRVLARLNAGEAMPPPGLTRSERERARRLLPPGPMAPRWSVAVMELGALVCTSREPRCEACPIADRCAWRKAGSPPHVGPSRRTQRYVGTDRQARGRLLAVLRHSPEPVSRTELGSAWAEPGQCTRALDSLVADGLVEPLGTDQFQLPGAPARTGRPIEVPG